MHRVNLGITPSPLVARVQRRRTSRHGEPQQMRKRTVKQDETGKVVVVFEWVPVPETGYTRRVAARSTIARGQRNVVPDKPKSGGPK